MLEFNFFNENVSEIGFSWAYDLLEIILVSICLHCYGGQQMREYPMMLVSSDPAGKINLAGKHSCIHQPSSPPYEKSHVWRCNAYYELMCTTRASETHGYQ